MRRFTILALAGVATGFLMLEAAPVRAGEAEKEDKDQKVALDQLPAAVKDALVKATEGGTIKEIEKEVKGGKTVYEADFITRDGKEMEIKLDEAGKVLKIKAGDDDKKEGDGQKESKKNKE